MLTKVRHEAAEFLAPILALSSAEIERAMEVPKKLEHGHLAYPVFALAKTLRKAPPAIATELAAQISEKKVGLPQLLSVTPVGGYLNFTFSAEYLQKILLSAVQNQGENLGHSDLGRGKTVVIDYSSPNVAKPMHVGHLRATAIGQAIRNLCETQGYKVIGLNHLGDWGVQFGKLAWAFQEWGADYDFEQRPFQSLFDMYVRFHASEEQNPDLSEKGSFVFRQLEKNDPEITKIWKKFVAISMVEYQRLWDLLGVKHDLVRGESFYNDRLKAVEKLLEDKSLLVESQGAMVVNLGDEMPPCLIRKSDGASLYATRDLASAIYRHDELKADVSLYVVGADQTLHFKQVFKVLDLMGYSWWQSCHHVSFGMYRFKEGQMSTRKGRVVFLEDVLDKAVAMVEKIIEAKNPALPNRELVARQVGIGAILFNDLLNDRVKNVDFDWDRVLDFEGDSGPHIQYCHVRCVSLLQKYGKSVPTSFATELQEAEERELLRTLLNYQDVLLAAASIYKPNILAQYLLDVTASFNHFYNKHRILGAPAGEAQEADRILLVSLTQAILKSGLKVLNIQAPLAM
jgi:arginyl-tRNA synthetase